MTFSGVLSPTCKEKNAVASKAGALAILKALLGLEVDPDSVPYETDERHLQGHDSIVSASSVRERDHVRVETA